MYFKQLELKQENLSVRLYLIVKVSILSIGTSVTLLTVGAIKTQGRGRGTVGMTTCISDDEGTSKIIFMIPPIHLYVICIF